jgi:type IV secretion system protein VirB4
MLPDFIPVVAHYDESTLLTKDGQLVRILKIKGYSDRFKKLDLPLDEKLRQLLNKFLNDKLMLYNITVRDFTSLIKDKDYQVAVAKLHGDLWMTEQEFNHCLMNNLYLVIVHKGARDLYSNFFAAFSKSLFTKGFFKKLEEASKELDTIILNLLEELEAYGASLLSVKLDQEEMESEPLSFMYYLLHLKDKNIAISKGDFSKLLTADLTIENYYDNFFLSRDITKELDYEAFSEAEPLKQEEKNQVALLTVKGLKALPSSYNDKILSLDNQLMIVEAINLTSKDLYKSKIQDFLNLYEMSKLDYGKDLLADLEQYQAVEAVTTVILFHEKPEELQKSLDRVTQLFCELGLNFIIEDYHKLSAFFSIIPGNSALFKRKNLSTIKESCNFTKIQQKALGGYQGSKWGQALTIFKSLDNLPFFFNFQSNEGIGHTIITGPNATTNNLLKNWLLSESLKFRTNIINFDQGSDATFFELLEIKTKKPSSNLIEDLNPSPKDLVKILTITFNLVLNKELEDNLVLLAGEILTLLKTKKDQAVQDLIKATNFNPEINQALIDFFNQKEFFLADNNISGLQNFSKLAEPYSSLMELLYLKKINRILTKENFDPYIITIDSKTLIKGMQLIEDFLQLLQELAAKEVVIIVTTQKESLVAPKIKELLKNFPTTFFFSDKYFDKNFAEIFSLNYIEVNNIKMYNPKDMIFLLKQDNLRLLASCKLLESLQV